jgi:hypothetical protein
MLFGGGDEKQRRERRAWEAEEAKELKNLKMLNWATSDAYAEEAKMLTERCTIEDRARDTSRAGHAPLWTKKGQQALEFERQKEDYLKLMEKLSRWTTGDEKAEKRKVLQYRLENLKYLLGVYDSQWREAFGRLQEDVGKGKQRILYSVEDRVDSYTSEKQKDGHDTESKREQSPPRRGRPKTKRAAPTRAVGRSGRVVKPTKSRPQNSPSSTIPRRSARVAARTTI